MIRFPPVDAALEGFRITRERPLAVLIWAGVLTVVNLLAQVWLTVSGLGVTLASWNAAFLSGKQPAELAGAMDRSGGGAALLLLGGLAVNTVLYTALLRVVLDPKDGRFGYLRLGMAEVRQFALGLLIFMALVVYATIANVVVAAGGALAVLVMVALALGGIYAVVRLSLAPAMTFAERRFTIMGAWSLTKDQFWGLLGAYVLAGVLAVLVSFLTFLIFGAVAKSLAMATHDSFDLLSAQSRDWSASNLAGIVAPAALILLLFSAFWTTLAFTIVSAVAPAAYRALSDRAAAPPT